MMNLSAFLGGILLVVPLTTIVNGLAIAEETQSNKVRVSLFYESLCPGCKQFTRQGLCPLYNSSMRDYVTVELVPYGNAKTNVSNTTGEITITCQHGPDECVGNRIQSCALKKLTYDQSTKYICCIESSDSPKMPEQCAEEFKLDYKMLKDCADGPEGQKLLYLNGQTTDQLRPQHEYVPWVLINGKHDERAESNLFVEVCDAIRDPKPAECNSVDY